jgi:hypothetical protein
MVPVRGPDPRPGRIGPPDDWLNSESGIDRSDIGVVNSLGFSPRQSKSDHLPKSTPMLDYPTTYPTYEFPLKIIRLKSCVTGGYVDADLVQLTKAAAYWKIHLPWKYYRGPFHTPCAELADSHWRWPNLVRTFRENPEVKCAAARTPDGVYQGAIIYRRDGVSLLEPDAKAVLGERLTTALHNRIRYAKNPLYRGVGQGLMMLSVIESYLWGFGGRVSLFSLQSSLDFYKKLNFIPTGFHEDDMIHVELVPEAATDLLKDKGLL